MPKSRSLELDARVVRFGQQHHVLGLEVAVDDARLVRRLQPREDFADDVAAVAIEQSGPTASACGSTARRLCPPRNSIDMYGWPSDLADVVDGDDVGVADVARGDAFADQALHRVLAREPIRADQLQRDFLLGQLVVRAIDDAHAAFADELDDRIAARRKPRRACIRG